MLDAFVLGSLRTFIAAAKRKLFSRWTQTASSSVPCQSDSRQSRGSINVQLFDRAKKKPRLTVAGGALLQEAKAVVQGADGFKARARTIAEAWSPSIRGH